VPARLRADWNGEPIPGKLDGPNDPRIGKFEMRVEATFRFCLPKVFGMGPVALYSTGSKHNRDQLYKGITDAAVVAGQPRRDPVPVPDSAAEDVVLRLTATAPRLEARSRWSHACKCPRMGAYGLLGVDPAQPTERQQGLMRRGRMLGAERYERYLLKYGEDNVIAEQPVSWPAGVLHPDIYLVPKKLVVEVKSSASPDSIIEDAIVQCAGQVYWHPEAEAGLVEVVSPIDLQVIAEIPVLLNDEWIERLEKIAADVVRAAATQGRELPDRVCRKPADGIGRFCPFVDHCFEGWEPPPLEEIQADEEIIARVARLHAIKQRRKLLSEHDRPLETEQKKLQAELDTELPVGKLLVGGYAVALSPRKRESFSLKKARASVPADILDPFTSHTQYTVYDVEKVDPNAVVVGDDFGDVPLGRRGSRMTFTLVGLALVAALALSGWIMAELELRDAHHELDEMQRDLDIALALLRAIHPTLSLVDGGEA
jgi:hypothetical protein